MVRSWHWRVDGPGVLTTGMSRLVARGAVSLLMLASAAMSVVAAAQRWWPACPRGAFDTEACWRVQDHELDYLMPSDPWTPVGTAAQDAGVATLLLAGAAALLPLVLARRVRWLPVLLAVVVSASLTVVGLHQWTAGVTGQVQPATAALPAALLWAVVVPVVVVVWLVRTTSGERDRRRAVRARWLGAALVASTPLPVALLGPVLLLYGSHDTTPWSEAVIAVPLTIAAVLVWVVTPGVPRVTAGSTARTVALARAGAV